jgi:acetate kinase
MPHRVLAINVGSSSIKASSFDVDRTSERALAEAEVERVGTPAPRLTMRMAASGSTEETIAASDMRAATDAVLTRLQPSTGTPAAIVHRVVHGGAAHFEPEWLTPTLSEDLNALRELAPEHLPAALDAIAVARARYPGVQQAVCYDTAFHRTLPEVAFTYALPARYRAQGIRRFGFHGLSCESVMRTLEMLDPEHANRRVVIAHLGSGASLTAVEHGKSIDTTMGCTPAGGVVMATRPGDLDPGIVTFAARHLDRDPNALDRALSHESGLLGLSESTSDVRDLLAREAADPRASLALEVFCYAIAKAVGALAAALQGLDLLVFTGGIGEHSADIRARVVQRLGWLGAKLSSRRNARQLDVISTRASRVTLRRVETDEDRMLARHAGDLLERTTGDV